jgi:hypothetical protein
MSQVERESALQLRHSTRWGRKQGEGDRHVHLPHAAALTSGDAFSVRSGVDNEFVKPTATRVQSMRPGLRGSRNGWGRRLEAVWQRDENFASSG